MFERSRRLEQFWSEDRSLSVLLSVLAGTAFVAVPIAQSTLHGGVVLDLFVALTFGAGVAAVSHWRWAAITTSLLAVASLAIDWVGRRSAPPEMHVAGALLTCAFAALVTALVLGRVLRDGPITIHRIVGSVAVYLLLGFAFGEVHRLLNQLLPGAYLSSLSSAIDRSELQYFSLVTLTTVGYGDIVPVHPVARSVATLEAFTGQLFPAILIARLVAMELAARGTRRD